MTYRAVDDDPESILRPSELRVYRMIARGLTYRQAAHELGLALGTVKEQMRSANRRMGVNSAIQGMNVLGWVQM